MSTLRNSIYYGIKPMMPASLRLSIRRWFARRQRARAQHLWPIQPGSERPPDGWPGWPAGRQFALVLTHDVEGQQGLENCRPLMEVEKKLGFRSSFNFIPEGGYRVSPEFRGEISRAGFEVGVHDLYHDGKLFRSRREFERNAARINEYLREWGAAGFRAGFMLNKPDWLHDLNIEYDASSFDTDPFEPQPHGRNTIFPFWVPGDSANRGLPVDPQRGIGNPEPGTGGYAELPYTLPQDSTLFQLFNERHPDIWFQKLDWIARHGGMALLNVHPDYIRFPGDEPSWRTYPVEYYTRFLEYVRQRYDGAYWQPLPRELAAFVSRFRLPQRPAPRRVCMLCYSDYLTDARVTRYAEALAERGDHVDVVALRRSPDTPVQQKEGGVNLFRFQTRADKTEKTRLAFLLPVLRFLASSSVWIARRHTREPYDLLHIHNVPDFLVFAGWWPRLTGARVILDIHDIVPEFYASKFKSGPDTATISVLKWIERLSAKNADHVIVSNHLWRERYAARTGVDGRCSVFINNVDEQVFRAARPASACANEKRIVLFPGGLQWHQGLDIAIRAFGRVSAELADVEFHIYGEGNMKSQLVALSRELGLEHVVRFFDPRPVREIARVMAGADLGVVPKRADSFGNEAYSTKILEFMSLGVPVVVSSTKIDRYYFDDSIVRFFESGNVDALSEAMLEVLGDADLRRGMVDRAAAYAARNAWSRRRLEYLDLVDSLVSGRGTKAVGRENGKAAAADRVVPAAGAVQRVQGRLPTEGQRGQIPSGTDARPIRMRFDRLITLNLFQPARRARSSVADLPCRVVSGRSAGAARGREMWLPVLMYHSVSDFPEEGVHPYYRTVTGPVQFARHMRWLSENGWHGTTLSGGLAWLQAANNSNPGDPAEGPCPEKVPADKRPVAITFDDGFRNFHTNAFPVLQAHRFAATMFLATGFIGEPRCTFRPDGAGRRRGAAFEWGSSQDCLTWREVRELHTAGIEFGSHTVTHPRLVDLPWEQVEMEARSSKHEIEGRLGVPVRTFAYPYAYPQANDGFVQRFDGVLRDAGFEACVTTAIGRVREGDDPYRLRRLPVNSEDDEALLQAKLEGHYDWLGKLQLLVKRVKARRLH